MRGALASRASSRRSRLKSTLASHPTPHRSHRRETPRGQRPFRTVVDGLGMGEPIEQINATTDAAVTGIYTAFGMADSLKVQA